MWDVGFFWCFLKLDVTFGSKWPKPWVSEQIMIIYVAGKITFCKPIKIIQSISREFLSVIFSQRYSIQKLWTCEPFNSRLVWTRRSSKYIHEKSDTMVKLDTKCSKKLLKCTWIFCGKFEQLYRIFGWKIYFMNQSIWLAQN